MKKILVVVLCMIYIINCLFVVSYASNKVIDSNQNENIQSVYDETENVSSDSTEMGSIPFWLDVLFCLLVLCVILSGILIPLYESRIKTLKRRNKAKAQQNDGHNNRIKKFDYEMYKKKLEQSEKLLQDKKIDEIPYDVRPKMLEIDYDNDSYIVISYSRKDFVKVYLFLSYLYNEGYRFWYDNGMKGTKKWLDEYKDKYENPNCLGSITFFSDNYISNSTKEEITIMHNANGYEKRNVMISLIPLEAFDANKALLNALNNERITISNANDILPVLTKVVEEEKDKTIHRYNNESDIRFLIDKIGSIFNIRNEGVE